MRMLPSKMVTLLVTIAFYYGREKKRLKKRNPWTRILLTTEKKLSVFHTKIDTCGRDLTANIVEGKRYVRLSLMASNILM